LQSNFQGVIITPLVGFNSLQRSYFLGSYFNSKKELKNSFSGVKIIPDIEELK